MAGVALLAATCACGVQYAEGTGCKLDAHSPHISKGELNKQRPVSIVGKVTFSCRVPVSAHEVTRWLERQVNGEWVRQTEEPPDTRIPVPNSEETTQAAFVGCVAGNWRTVGYATAVFRGERFRSGPHSSKPLDINEKKCAEARKGLRG